MEILMNLGNQGSHKGKQSIIKHKDKVKLKQQKPIQIKISKNAGRTTLAITQGNISNIEPSTVFVPPTHTNVVNPPSSSSHPSGAQPVTDQSSRGYGYQIPIGNHPPNPTGMPYAGIPYSSNTFMAWGKPN